MVETTQKNGAASKVASKFASYFENDPKMSAENSDLDKTHQILTKNLSKFYQSDRSTIEQTIDALFEVAASKMSSDEDKEVLGNLRKHVQEAEQTLYRPQPYHLDAFFFPNMSNVDKLVRYIQKAKKSLIICVFNLTNDKLADAVLERHRDGVDVRIITDDETMTNKGNDCQMLADNGIPVRRDSDEVAHMHNKFMLVDSKFLLTGSFNWTFQAGSKNQENLLVVDHPYYIEKYTTEFDKLWVQFIDNEVDRNREAAARKIQKSYRNKQARDQTKANKSNNSRLPKAQSAPGYKFQGW